MTVQEIASTLDFQVSGGTHGPCPEVTGGYAGDLLSDVIANGKAGNVWVTMQIHVNIVAVAVLKEFAAIILVNGRQPEAQTLQRALDEKVTILTSRQPAFETIGRLWALGVGNVP